jgi:hypothetical protein
MTIRAQAPAVAVGDRFSYTTPDGRTAHYRVELDVVAAHGPGFVRLVADEPEWGDVTIRPEGLASSYGWTREQGATAAGEGVGRVGEPRPQNEGTEPAAGSGAGQRQGEADCSEDFADEFDDELDCTHCNGEGDCWDGADPLGDCPDEIHPCHACGGSGRRSDQRIF